MVNVASRSIMTLAIVSCLPLWPAIAADPVDPVDPIAPVDAVAPVEVRYWLSPDGQQLYVTTVPKEHPEAARLYYFSNEADRLCYTFSVPGRWKLDEATGSMLSEDGKTSLGQSLQNASDLKAAKHARLVDVAAEAYKVQFLESIAVLSAQGFDIGKNEPKFTTVPFETTARQAFKWAATVIATRDGRDAVIEQHQMLVEVAPGWLLAIESSDEIARAAIESFATAEPPDCFRPFIREHFPQVEKSS